MKEEDNDLNRVLEEVTRAVKKGVEDFDPSLETEEVGRVKSVGQGIVWAEGLGSVKSEELVTVGPDIPGMALDILPDRVGIVLFGRSDKISAGDEVTRSGRVLDVPVSNETIGRVIDPLGVPLDGQGPFEEQER